MNWSWRLGKIAGIDVYVHFTFLLLLGWVGWQHYQVKPTVGYVFIGLASIAVLFFIIVLHELGHALAARRYGIQTKDITLLPIGGLARLERMPDDPKEELVVALAGPLVNVVIAASLFIGLSLADELHPWDVLAAPGGKYVVQLMWVNVILAVFNLIPAFPMDGGRVLRALLALRTDYVKATAIAASIGQGMAVLFGFAGLFWNPMLLFIALFVWVGAEQEAKMVALGSALSAIPVRDAMMTRFHALRPEDSLGEAANAAQGGFQQDFPVMDGAHLVGLLPRSALITALQKSSPASPVAETMKRDFAVVSPADALDHVFELLSGDEPAEMVPVMQDGQLVGLLTHDSIGRCLAHRKALRPQVRPA